jgi:hypothetical protein
MDTAKFVFCAPLPVSAAVFTPTIAPDFRLISGPPELPALIGASVWIISPPSSDVRPDTMPRVPVNLSPQG